MTPTEAMRAVSALITVGSWDDAAVATWAEEIAALDDPGAAMEASRQIRRNHARPGRPTLGEWLSAYRAIRQRRMEAPAISSGSVGSLADALPGIFARALKGSRMDREAVEGFRKSRWPDTAGFADGRIRFAAAGPMAWHDVFDRLVGDYDAQMGRAA